MSRLKMNGYIIDDDYGPLYEKYGYSVIYPNAVRTAIENNPEGEDLILEINSGGGSVFSGFEIFSILKSAKCNTIAEIQSLAGSAASTIACGCKQVLMSPVGQMMIHDPVTGTYGNIRDHKESTQALTAIKESILNGYAQRCGDKATRAKLADLMSKETWLPAQQAVELGLADGILYAGETDPAAIVNAAQVGFREYVNSCSVLPPIEDLLAREQHSPGSNPTGKAPDNKNDAWKAEAALAIEKERFI